MGVVFILLAVVCLSSAVVAASRIIRNYQIRKKGGIASSPIRSQRLRNKRR